MIESLEKITLQTKVISVVAQTLAMDYPYENLMPNVFGAPLYVVLDDLCI